MSEFNVRANVMQNSAISFSLVVNDDPLRVDALLKALSTDYQVHSERNTQLITVRNYENVDLQKLLGTRKVWLEQRGAKVLQLLAAEA